MERKYLFEAGLNVYTSYKTIISVEHLKELEQIDTHKYHIYGILAYPKIYFKNDKVYTDKEGIHICLFCPTENNKEYVLPVWEISDDIDYSKVKIKQIYPYSKMIVTIEDKAFLESHPEVVNESITLVAQELFGVFAEGLISKQEFEVLYIGQAYGQYGERTAFTRLSAHSTLQKILTDCQTKYSDKHIYIILLEFTPILNMTFDGLSKQYTMSEDVSDQHMNDVITNLPEEQQIINITEAAIINYFKPEYNVNFVENFPDENHRGYKQYFDLDYNCLTVEFDLEFNNAPTIQLYSSKNRINSSFDFIRYELFNDNNRLNMYDIFKGTSKN